MPTVREICVGTDLSSTSSVFNHLLALEDEGTIIVDGVDSLEDAEEYIESCNSIDKVKWSGVLEAMQGGTELQKISIPDSMAIKEFADKILVCPAEIIRWLFLRGSRCIVAEYKN